MLLSWCALRVAFRLERLSQSLGEDASEKDEGGKEIPAASSGGLCADFESTQGSLRSVAIVEASLAKQRSGSGLLFETQALEELAGLYKPYAVDTSEESKPPVWPLGHPRIISSLCKLLFRPDNSASDLDGQQRVRRKQYASFLYSVATAMDAGAASNTERADVEAAVNRALRMCKGKYIVSRGGIKTNKEAYAQFQELFVTMMSMPPLSMCVLTWIRGWLMHDRFYAAHMRSSKMVVMDDFEFFLGVCRTLRVAIHCSDLSFLIYIKTCCKRQR